MKIFARALAALVVVAPAAATDRRLQKQRGSPNDDKRPSGVAAQSQFSCTEDSECDDGDNNTGDTCYVGVCKNPCLNEAACDDGSGCTVDTCTGGVCSHDTIPGVSIVELELLTDNYAGETAWNFKMKSTGELLKEGDGLADGTLYEIQAFCPTEEMTEDMEVIFTITDSYGDGICCSEDYGEGYYKIMVNGDEVASGGEFGRAATTTLVVPPPVVATTPPPVAPPPVPTPPVGGESAPTDPAVITIDFFTMRFTFAPQPRPACVGNAAGWAAGRPTGSSLRQCAQACASLAACDGFDALDDPSGGACVLSMDGSSECDDAMAPNAVYYHRATDMHFD